jgi:hypothetical protein
MVDDILCRAGIQLAPAAAPPKAVEINSLAELAVVAGAKVEELLELSEAELVMQLELAHARGSTMQLGALQRNRVVKDAAQLRQAEADRKADSACIAAEEEAARLAAAAASKQHRAQLAAAKQAVPAPVPTSDSVDIFAGMDTMDTAGMETFDEPFTGVHSLLLTVHSLLLSVTEANDKPADPLYTDSIVSKSLDFTPAAVDALSHWLCCRLAKDSIPCKVKTFKLMTRLINEVRPK